MYICFRCKIRMGSNTTRIMARTIKKLLSTNRKDQTVTRASYFQTLVLVSATILLFWNIYLERKIHNETSPNPCNIPTLSSNRNNSRCSSCVSINSSTLPNKNRYHPKLRHNVRRHGANVLPPNRTLARTIHTVTKLRDYCSSELQQSNSSICNRQAPDKTQPSTMGALPDNIGGDVGKWNNFHVPQGILRGGIPALTSSNNSSKPAPGQQ